MRLTIEVIQAGTMMEHKETKTLYRSIVYLKQQEIARFDWNATQAIAIESAKAFVGELAKACTDVQLNPLKGHE